MPEIVALVRGAGGVMTYEAGQTYIKHFSAGGNLEKFVVTPFSGFYKQNQTRSCRRSNALNES